MNVVMMAALTKYNERQVRRHLVAIRSLIKDFAKDDNGKTRFTCEEAQDYFFFLRTIKKNRNLGLKEAAIALIKFKERKRIIREIESMLKVEIDGLLA